MKKKLLEGFKILGTDSNLDFGKPGYGVVSGNLHLPSFISQHRRTGGRLEDEVIRILGLKRTIVEQAGIISVPTPSSSEIMRVGIIPGHDLHAVVNSVLDHFNSEGVPNDIASPAQVVVLELLVSSESIHIENLDLRVIDYLNGGRKLLDQFVGLGTILGTAIDVG